MTTRKKKSNKEKEITNTSITPAPSDSSLSDTDLKNFNEFVKKLDIKSNKTNESSIEQLANILKEYTNCYLLIGYNLDKQAIVVSYTDSVQDNNALTELLRQVFFNTVNGEDDSE